MIQPQTEPHTAPGVTLLQRLPAIFRTGIGQARQVISWVWREQRHWCLLGLLLLALWGYVAWLLGGVWFRFDSPLLFQTFIPLFALGLGWAHRHEVQTAYQEFCLLWPPESKKRYGNIGLAIVGCVLLVLVNIVLIPSLAVLAFLLMVAGILYAVYGWHIFRWLWQSWLILLLMIPPPTDLLGRVTFLLQSVTANAVSLLLLPIIPGVKTFGPTLLLPTTRLFVSESLSGITLVIPGLAFTLWFALLKRVPLLSFPALFMIALLTTLVGNILRVAVYCLIVNTDPSLASKLAVLPSWLLLLPLLAALTPLIRLFAPRKATPIAGASQVQEPTAHPEVAPIRRTTFWSLTGLLTVTAVVVGVCGYRLSRKSLWLPQPTVTVNEFWDGSIQPINRDAVLQLGNPPNYGFVYTNLVGDTVEVQIIATPTYLAFLDPRYAMNLYGFGLTAQKIVPLFGEDGPVRTLVFRRPNTQQMVMMYYWVQKRGGKTSIGETLTPANDLLPRWRLGMETIAHGGEDCVVRVLTVIQPLDTHGYQTQRNLNELCRALHKALKDEGPHRTAGREDGP